MSSIPADRLQMALQSNPRILRFIQAALAASPPTSHNSFDEIVDRCNNALEALELYMTYLHPRPCAVSTISFAGKTEADTWTMLRKWFVNLNLWTPAFVTNESRLDMLLQTRAFDHIVRAIFNLIHVFIYYYPYSIITRRIFEDQLLPKMCILTLYTALTLENVSLHPVASVMAHERWGRDVFKGEHNKTLLEEIFSRYCDIDFVTITVNQFIHTVERKAAVQRAAALHALVTIIIQLIPLKVNVIMAQNTAWWFGRYIACFMQQICSYARRLPNKRSGVDIASVGRLLTVCFWYLNTVTQKTYSSGWVLNALDASML
ncbi:hypothetical protein VNI00_011822 [Paramarasmius palmivorus]|uniref:Uncharacterized protein n=1 Tax=Paramarasmius palmivorus TaxID=297713 RepID=A0AAW0C8Y6_9AGAR